MFPEILFPDWLFPDWLFPHWGGSATPPAVLPPHLAGAIKARFGEVDQLVAQVTGGIFQDKLKQGATVPYAVFSIDSRRRGFESSDSTWMDTQIRFALTATTGAGAEALALLVRASYLGSVFRYQAGMTTPLVVSQEPSAAKAKARGAGDKSLWTATVEFQCYARVGRVDQ